MSKNSLRMTILHRKNWGNFGVAFLSKPLQGQEYYQIQVKGEKMTRKLRKFSHIMSVYVIPKKFKTKPAPLEGEEPPPHGSLKQGDSPPPGMAENRAALWEGNA